MASVKAKIESRLTKKARKCLCLALLSITSTLIASDLFAAAGEDEESIALKSSKKMQDSVQYTKTQLPELKVNVKNALVENNVMPDALIQKATEELVNRIKDAKQAQKTINFYYNLVDEKVSPFVDYKLIARRVMGRHYKMASEKERDGFVIKFRESLISTYAKGIAGYKDQSLVFLPFEGVRTKKGKTRAKVEMEIRSPSDVPIKVLYQMFLNSEQAWKLENIVLNGVNLGLTFRNQFSESYKVNAGDFSKVISNWGET